MEIRSTCSPDLSSQPPPLFAKENEKEHLEDAVNTSYLEREASYLLLGFGNFVKLILK